MMPVMDGPAMIHALRRVDPKVKIIASSGLSANGDAAKIAGAGVQDFLNKPYTARALLRSVRWVLDDR
jgi:CheY-like chemotaxis protein